MKTKTTLLAAASVMLLLLNPFILSAQWSAVRFDQHNTFYLVSAPTLNTVFVTGTEPVNSEYFILRTNDGGINWDSISVNTATDIFLLTELSFLNTNTGFVGGTKNGNQALLKTTDNGNSWTEITPNPSSAASINSVYFVDSQYGFATDGAFLYQTANGGNVWTTMTSPFNMRDMFFSDMINGTACGDNSGMAVVMQTADGGQNWSTMLSDSGSSFVNSFAKLDVVDAYTIFTAMEYTNKLYRTVNSGNSWQTILVDSTDLIRDFDFDTEDVGHVLGDIGWGLENRIMLTTNGGQDLTTEYTTGWNFYGGGVSLNAFDFVEGTGYTTGSSGLVKKYTPISTGINEEAFSTTTSIYPNPATTELIINNSGLKIERVEIYDVVGKNVFSEQPAANSKQLIINVSTLSPGIYFVKTGNEVRKFIKE